MIRELTILTLWPLTVSFNDFKGHSVQFSILFGHLGDTGEISKSIKFGNPMLHKNQALETYVIGIMGIL